MNYKNIICGTFHSRINRFIAKVYIGDKLETVPVKNTGRLAELLLPGAVVVLEISDNPKRKTKYDLICVYKENLGWVNIDSQAPNKVVGECLKEQDDTFIRPEYNYGASRVDFYMGREPDDVLSIGMLLHNHLHIFRQRGGKFHELPSNWMVEG